MAIDWRLISEAPDDMQSILAYVPGTWELPCEYAVVFKKTRGYVYQQDDHTYCDGITHFAYLENPKH